MIDPKFDQVVRDAVVVEIKDVVGAGLVGGRSFFDKGADDARVDAGLVYFHDISHAPGELQDGERSCIMYIAYLYFRTS